MSARKRTVSRTIVINSIFLALILGGSVGLGLWLLRPEGSGVGGGGDSHGTSLLRFPPFSYDVTVLRAQWAAQRDGVELTIGPDERALMEAFYDINAQSLRNDITAEELQTLNEQMVVWVDEYIGVHGVAAFRELGWTLVEEFQAAVEAVLAEARQSGRQVAAVLADDSAEMQAARQRTGNFFATALENGLITPRGELRYDESLLAILFRFRWFGFAESYSSTQLMTAMEEKILWRWRIEAAEGLSMRQRLTMVDRAEAFYRPQIDPDAIRGIIAFESDNPELARDYFRRAARRHPDDRRYQRYLRLIAEVLEGER